MSSEENKNVAANSIIYAVAGFIMSSTLLSAFVLNISLQDTWVVVIIGAGLSALVVLGYAWLSNKFPGKTIIEINSIVFGNIIGKVVSVLYLLFFLLIAALNLRDTSGFITGYIMTQTPPYIISALFMLVCALAVRKGIRIILRYGFMFVVIALSVTLLNFILLYNLIEFDNFLPVFSQPLISYVQGAHIITTVPITETVAFLMIVSNVSNRENLKKSMLLGLAIGCFSLLVSMLVHIGVLGQMSTLMALPSFELIRLINIGDIITRLDILYAFVLLLLQFFKISILHFALTRGIGELFGLNSFRPIVFVVGSIITSISISLFGSAVENFEWGTSVAPMFNTAISVLLPFITIIIAKLRMPNKKKAGNQEVKSA